VLHPSLAEVGHKQCGAYCGPHHHRFFVFWGERTGGACRGGVAWTEDATGSWIRVACEPKLPEYYGIVE
jgi:hypothetical protein